MIAIYMVCLVVTICTFGNYQKKLIILLFNNEKIHGKITDIEHVFRPGGGSYNRIYYIFDYNGEKYSRSITKDTGGLGGIINGFTSLLMNRHYRIGQKVQILYNDELNFSYVRNELSSRIIAVIILVIFISFIGLILIIGIESKLKKYFKKIKYAFLIYKDEMIFYTQDNDYNTVDEVFDYKKVILKQLMDGTILCYGIKKGKNFIELSYFNSNYIFRIYKNGNEKETISDGSKNIKEQFKGLVNEL